MNVLAFVLFILMAILLVRYRRRLKEMERMCSYWEGFADYSQKKRLEDEARINKLNNLYIARLTPEDMKAFYAIGIGEAVEARRMDAIARQKNGGAEWVPDEI